MDDRWCPCDGGSACRLNELTATKQKIAQLVAEGLANKAIALRLGVAEDTVKHHVSDMLAVLGLPNRAAIATFVARCSSPTPHESGDSQPPEHNV